MPKIEMYMRPTCPYCIRAMALLDGKGIDYEKIEVDLDPAKKKEMIERSGGRTTVPQIFIDGRHIGGCDALHRLEDEGKLDPLLAD